MLGDSSHSRHGFRNRSDASVRVGGHCRHGSVSSAWPRFRLYSSSLEKMQLLQSDFYMLLSCVGLGTTNPEEQV